MIKPGDIYRNTRNGHLYMVTQMIPIKVGDTWVEGIIYMADRLYFARTLEDFKASFELEDPANPPLVPLADT